MTPRPLHRSRLFWLGLPGLVFLLWGWWDSTHYRTIFGRTTATGHVQVQSIGHMVMGIEVRGEGPPWSGSWAFLHLPETMVYADPKTGRMVNEYRVLPRYVAYKNRVYSDGSSMRRVEVAYWFMVAVYGCAWVSACVVWQRRKRRLMHNDVADAAEVGRS